ncbi:MAG: hypothetical protein FJW14_14330 [Acidimicrobiia bacterium]|nr:hypothetical protein [Acidimicrobiia bacterium]
MTTRSIAIGMAAVLISSGVAAQQKPAAPPPPPASPTVVYKPQAARRGGPLTPRTAGYKVDAIDLTLIPGQTVEYKFRLDRGATMVYSWKVVEGANVKYDFHTVPDGKPISASERMEAAEKNQAHGVYVAPYAGLHGWWWENSSNDIATIRINASGFFTEAVMFAPEPTEMEVQDPPPPPEF